MRKVNDVLRENRALLRLLAFDARAFIVEEREGVVFAARLSLVTARCAGI